MRKQGLEQREYQQNAVRDVVDQFVKGRESVLLESPVGSGKTVMGLMAVAELQRQNPDLAVNWCATRHHILEQTHIMNRRWFGCRINLVSVFSKNPPRADLVVLDEAHHEATQSCLEMYERTGNRHILGLSATPMRTDRMRLSFQSTVRCCSIQELIHMGVLSPYHSYKLPEWSVELAAKVFCMDPNHWGKSLAFFRTIQECMDFREKLALKGITCDVVTGKSNKDAQIEAFRTGAVQVIANVAVLGEGFDVPDLESVFIRDASRLPTIQMAGRGLRRAQGKAFCKLVQGGNTGYAVERIAAPAESFRYMRGTWLSCAGNTQAITEAIERIEQLQAKRETYFVQKPILHPLRWISVSTKYLQ